MGRISHDIFRAIHEGRWLYIAYHNREGQVTRYWIGIRGLDPVKRCLSVDGLHLGRYTVRPLDRIYIDQILSSEVIEGSYQPVEEELVEDIARFPHKYKGLFGHTVNLKILNYLEMCHRMDAVPYRSDFGLIRFLDRDSFQGDCYPLRTEQFQAIVKEFQYKTEKKTQTDGRLRLQQLGMNVLSLHTEKGLYVLAYRKLQLDVKERVLRPDEDITICTEYILASDRAPVSGAPSFSASSEVRHGQEGRYGQDVRYRQEPGRYGADKTVESIRKYLDADEYELLADFERNKERIKDCITRRGRALAVDDMPYIIGLGMDIPLDLHKEYQAIMEMYDQDKVTVPIRAFFGELQSRPIRRKNYPIATIDRKVNLDQLLAIHNAMKYPLAYIQGPPGTGKTNTIINTIVTALFNERTVLFASYNNQPVDSVFEKLSGLCYQEKTIPFPVLRLGNTDKVREAVRYIKRVYRQAKEILVYGSTLDKNRDDRIRRTKQLSLLLRRYEEVLDLKERRETLDRLTEYQERMGVSMEMLPFQADLQGRQRAQIDRRIKANGQITEEEAIALLDDDGEAFYKYLFYMAVRYIRKLEDPKFKDLWEILDAEEEKEQVSGFKRYLSDTENVKKLQKVFPIMITTCISAHRLGAPEPMFDMVIMDEASQCNTAVSLVPVIRGGSLMLVGDPQQLDPVILLDELVNERLKKRYGISEEYDYRKNSIYKTYLACDAVSDEILLHHHYRCDRRIIQFNNKKYYHSKLDINTIDRDPKPLLFIDVEGSRSKTKNTAPDEVGEIIRYARANQDKSIGVITPFVNQKQLIFEAVEKEQLSNVTCGTVHAFQGDEKDVILFSTAITEQTQAGTYGWLKNNKELINVATSRARDRLVVLADQESLERLHRQGEEDDLYELVRYVQRNGDCQVTQKKVHSRALGVKPFTTATEEAFLANLNHALENIWLSQSRFTVRREMAAAEVFDKIKNGAGGKASAAPAEGNALAAPAEGKALAAPAEGKTPAAPVERKAPAAPVEGKGLHSSAADDARFDFVVCERREGAEIPVLAVWLEGRAHHEDEEIRRQEQRKKAFCRTWGLQVICVENTYARRYDHIKQILTSYFSVRH